MRRYDRGPPRGGLVRLGIRGIAGGVGLISESLKAHKDKKTMEQENEAIPGSEGLEVRKDKKTMEREDEAIPGHYADHEDKAVSNRDASTIEEPPPSYASATDSKADHAEQAVEKDLQAQPAVKEESDDQDEKAHLKSESGDSLENEWNLDDAQVEMTGDLEEKCPSYSSQDLETAFLRDHAVRQDINTAPTGNLSLPVILPQRRPKDRSRGFIRAYAPLLDNCGIDQTTWLAFLDTFQKSSAADPWINAINLASFATMLIPHGFGNLVDYAIQQATKIAIELQARKRTSAFLQKINEEFFRPRGLFCLVMTWNPESSYQVEQVNLTSTIESRSKSQTGLAGLQSKYRSSDGQTFGELQFPEVAPLIFPALDQLAAQTSAEGVKKKNKMAKGMTFVANYWDKRATAEYAGKNPNSLLANVPQGEFSSRYADPNHAAASGSLISFVSGGHLVPAPNSRGLIGGIASVVGQAVRGEHQGAEWERMREQQRIDPRYNPYSRYYRGMYQRDGLISTPVGAYRKFMKKNVLYLMVVNMPSEKEMAAAKAATQH